MLYQLLMLPLAGNRCDKIFASQLDFEVQVEMSGFNKAKMEFDYRVIRLRDGAVAVEGHTRNVFTDKEGHIIRLEPKWYDKIYKVYAADKAEKEK